MRQPIVSSLLTLSTLLVACSASDGSSPAPTGGTAGAVTDPGTAGTGAVAPPVTNHTVFYSSTAQAADLAAYYSYWKARYVVDCGDSALVRNSRTIERTYSEGIGYGMLIAVAFNDKDLFDKLWNYYNKAANPRGLMMWHVTGCAPVATEPSNVTAASDAELDAAMALIQAACKWGDPGYNAAAVDLIGKIKAHEIDTYTFDNGYTASYIIPGDAFGDESCVNVSYFSPAYYRAFAQVTGDASWNTMANDVYAVLGFATNPTTGLPRDFSTVKAGISSCRVDLKDYSYDAGRTPWRIGADWMWYGDVNAQNYLRKVLNWANGVGVANIKQIHTIEGAAVSTNAADAVIVGALAAGSMALSQAEVDQWSNHLIQNTGFPTELNGAMSSDYFKDTTKMLYLISISGNFLGNVCL